MPERTGYQQGTPCWVDVAEPDVEGAGRFYGALFGWELGEDMGEEAGHYRFFRKDGKDVAGIGPEMGEPSPMWTTYLKVDDAAAACAAVAANGGQVLMGPMDLPGGSGRIAIVMDPVGAVCGLQEPGSHTGAQLVNEPGTLIWNELTTRDPETASTFWSAVLGVGVETGGPDMPTYRMLTVGGEGVAGIMPMEGDLWPPELPSHWMTYFAVADTDATCARALELGGAVPVPPFDITIGRCAVLHDPFGKTFSIIHMTDPGA